MLWCILWPSGWTVCQRGECLEGELFLVLSFCQIKSPLVHYDRTWIKMLFSHILSCHFVLDLSYNLPHLTEPVESSQNQPHIHFCYAKQDTKIRHTIWFSLRMRTNPLSWFKAVCYLHGRCAPGYLYYTAAIICVCVSTLWHTQYVAVKL